MSRYIDADKLMLDIRLDKRSTFRGAKIPPSVKETMFAYLDSAPSIDIVRCNECRHWCCHNDVDYDQSKFTYYCEVHGISLKGDEFCSYGEREGE